MALCLCALAWRCWLATDCTAAEDVRTIGNAPKLFQDHGYDWIAGPYTPTANVVLWAEALQAAKQGGKNCLGMLDVQFAYPPAVDVHEFGNVPNVGAAGWNVGAFLANPSPVRNVTNCG